MIVRFLGTGSSHGIPVIGCKCKVCQSANTKDKRLRSSIFIETENQKLLIDVSPDFRQQMLREQITHIDAVLFTHEHKDHTGGIDDLRAYNYLMKSPINIFAEPRVISSIKNDYEYIFAEKHYPGAPQVKANQIDNNPFTLNGDTIVPIRIYHGELPIYGFRIKNTAYLTDLKTIDNKEKQKLKNLDLLILGCIREEPHPAHLGLNDALQLIDELQPKQTYLTHISHIQKDYKTLNQWLPNNIQSAYDGLILNI